MNRRFQNICCREIKRIKSSIYHKTFKCNYQVIISAGMYFGRLRGSKIRFHELHMTRFTQF